MNDKEQRINSGVLFINSRKEKDNHPDYTGNVTQECPHCKATFASWISGWFKTSSNGTEFQSLAFKPKDAPTTAPTAATGNPKPAGFVKPPAATQPASAPSSTGGKPDDLPF